MTRKMLFWWFAFCAQLFGLFLAYYSGLFTLLLAADPTYISYAILVIHLLVVIVLGWHTYKEIQSNNEVFWYISEMQLSLGMLGTLIGFVIMFSAVFAGVPSVENIKQSVSLISIGVSTALWTTLVGLASGMIIKGLMVNHERKDVE